MSQTFNLENASNVKINQNQSQIATTTTYITEQTQPPVTQRISSFANKHFKNISTEEFTQQTHILQSVINDNVSINMQDIGDVERALVKSVQYQQLGSVIKAFKKRKKAVSTGSGSGGGSRDKKYNKSSSNGGIGIGSGSRDQIHNKSASNRGGSGHHDHPMHYNKTTHGGGSHNKQSKNNHYSYNERDAIPEPEPERGIFRDRGRHRGRDRGRHRGRDRIKDNRGRDSRRKHGGGGDRRNRHNRHRDRKNKRERSRSRDRGDRLRDRDRDNRRARVSGRGSRIRDNTSDIDNNDGGCVNENDVGLYEALEISRPKHIKKPVDGMNPKYIVLKQIPATVDNESLSELVNECKGICSFDITGHNAVVKIDCLVNAERLYKKFNDMEDINLNLKFASKNLVIKNIPHSIKNDHLQTIFECFGEIGKFNVVIDNALNRIAFCSMIHHKDAIQALFGMETSPLCVEMTSRNGIHVTPNEIESTNKLDEQIDRWKNHYQSI